VPITSQVAREWGRLAGANVIPALDGLIGATARVHGWTVVTRNTKDFGALDVPVLNPFADS
jgi:predicted nucleic acid-binding protein